MADTPHERLTLEGQPVKDDDARFAQDVRAGLTHDPKFLPCRHIYDETGSQLFERICELPEYYLTRAEAEILRDRAAEVAALLPEDVYLIELGSGNSSKTRVLLEALLEQNGRLHYVPVDVSREFLAATAMELLDLFPELHVTAFAGDYENGLAFAADALDGPKCFVWLGSSIGNLERADALTFLKAVAAAMGDQDRLLIGIDLQKDRRTLEAAYNDAAGVTAAFNKNILTRINRELGADFDLESFDHSARYHDRLGRVESRLISRRAQEVRIDGLDLTVSFEPDESIHTENSHKYSLEEIDALGERVGFQTKRRWLDSARRFSLNLFAPQERP